MYVVRQASEATMEEVMSDTEMREASIEVDTVETVDGTLSSQVESMSGEDEHPGTDEVDSA